jgi:hypothetical protein
MIFNWSVSQDAKERLSGLRRPESRDHLKPAGAGGAVVLLGRFRRRRGHFMVHVMPVVVMVMMVVVVVVMMLVVMHLVGHRSGGGRFLRDGIAGEADGESGGGDKALDHGQSVLSKKTPFGLRPQSAGSCLNSR